AAARIQPACEAWPVRLQGVEGGQVRREVPQRACRAPSQEEDQDQQPEQHEVPPRPRRRKGTNLGESVTEGHRSRTSMWLERWWTLGYLTPPLPKTQATRSSWTGSSCAARAICLYSIILVGYTVSRRRHRAAFFFGRGP